MEMGAKEDWEKGEEAVGVNRKEYYRSFVNRQLFSTIQNISFFIKEVNVRNKKSVRQREVILNNFDVCICLINCWVDLINGLVNVT